MQGMKNFKKIIKYSVITALYAAITASLSLSIFKSHLYILGGKSIDLPGNAWYQWFTARCLLRLDFSSLYSTSMIAYPSGKSFLFDVGFPLLQFFSIPFQAIFNFPVSYNLLIIALSAANGLACFMLIDYLCGDTIAAFLGGLFFSINPYTFYHINGAHPEMLAMFWIPLFFIFLFKIKNEKNKKHTITAAIILALASLSYWYYGVLLIICSVIFLLYFSIRQKGAAMPLTKKIILVLLLYGIFMAITFFYPIVIQGARPSGYEIIKPFPLFQDIINHKTPAYFSYMTQYTSLHYIPSMFFVLAAVIMIASLFSAGAAGINIFCIITGSIFLILSLGPYISIFNNTIPLPYILLYYLVPSFPRLWWPINCFAVTLAFLSILIGYSIHRLNAGNHPKTKFLFLFIAVIAYLLPYYNGKYNLPFIPSWLRIQPVNYSPYTAPKEVYYYLGEQPDCAIIELPFQKEGRMDFFANQPVHEKKLFNCPGYPIKEIVWPKKHLQFLRLNTFLRYLDILSSDTPAHQEIPDNQALKDGLKELYSINIKFIVINPQYFSGNEAENKSIEKLKKVLKKPFKEYGDGTLLYRIEDLIHD